MAMSQREYDDLVRRETARYGRGPVTGRGGTESARDAAVRNANIQAGFGNSTALRKLQPNAVGGGVKPEQAQPRRRRGDGDRTASTTRPLPEQAPVPTPRLMGLPAGDAGGVDLSLARSVPYQQRMPELPPPVPNLGIPANPAMSQGSVLQTPNPALAANVMQTPTSAPGSRYPQYGAGGLPDISLARSMPYASRMPDPAVAGVGMPTAYGGPPLIDRSGYSLPKFRWWGS